MILLNYQIHRITSLNYFLYLIYSFLAVIIGKLYIDLKKDGEAAEYLNQGVTIFKELGILNN